VSTTAGCTTLTELVARFRATRRRTLDLCEPLTAEDMMVQSCPEASPAKWHLAHTAWFFESFILREFLPGYRLFNEDFSLAVQQLLPELCGLPLKSACVPRFRGLGWRRFCATGPMSTGALTG